jgi:hypothetical protein
LALLVCWLTQLPLQLMKPALQVIPQTRLVQVAVPLAGAGQVCPHVPQLVVVLRLVQVVPQQPYPVAQHVAPV